MRRSKPRWSDKNGSDYFSLGIQGDCLNRWHLPEFGEMVRNQADRYQGRKQVQKARMNLVCERIWTCWHGDRWRQWYDVGSDTCPEVICVLWNKRLNGELLEMCAWVVLCVCGLCACAHMCFYRLSAKTFLLSFLFFIWTKMFNE